MLLTIHTTSHHTPAWVELLKSARLIVLNAEGPKGVDNSEALLQHVINRYEHEQGNSLIAVHAELHGSAP